MHAASSPNKWTCGLSTVVLIALYIFPSAVNNMECTDLKHLKNQKSFYISNLKLLFFFFIITDDYKNNCKLTELY